MPSNHELPDEEFKWTEVRIKRLIHLVKGNKHLWHNSAEGFTGNPEKRVNLFIDVAEDIGTTAYEANRRFTSLRERYGKESKKKDEETIRWPYYKNLNFLDEVIRRRVKRKMINTSLETSSNKNILKTEEPVEGEEYLTPIELYEENNKRLKVQENTSEDTIYVMEHEVSDETIQRTADKQINEIQDETIQAAFKYFQIELKKMDEAKREYCIDQMMMAFLKAKSSYQK